MTDETSQEGQELESELNEATTNWVASEEESEGSEQEKDSEDESQKQDSDSETEEEKEEEKESEKESETVEPEGEWANTVELPDGTKVTMQEISENREKSWSRGKYSRKMRQVEKKEAEIQKQEEQIKTLETKAQGFDNLQSLMQSNPEFNQFFTTAISLIQQNKSLDSVFKGSNEDDYEGATTTEGKVKAQQITADNALKAGLEDRFSKLENEVKTIKSSSEDIAVDKEAQILETELASLKANKFPHMDEEKVLLTAINMMDSGVPESDIDLEQLSNSSHQQRLKEIEAYVKDNGNTKVPPLQRSGGSSPSGISKTDQVDTSKTFAQLGEQAAELMQSLGTES